MNDQTVSAHTHASYTVPGMKYCSLANGKTEKVEVNTIKNDRIEVLSGQIYQKILTTGNLETEGKSQQEDTE